LGHWLGGGLAPLAPGWPSHGPTVGFAGCMQFWRTGQDLPQPSACVDDRGGGRPVNETLKRSCWGRTSVFGGRGRGDFLTAFDRRKPRSAQRHGRRRGAKGAHQGPAARSARSAPSAAQWHRGGGRSCRCSRRADCHGAEVSCTEPKRGVSGTAAGPAVGPAVAYASPRSAALPAAAAVRSGIPVVASGAACGTVRQERDSLSGGTSCVTTTAARSGGIAAR
jgi:hypothetical protein